jgi:hypothetical protein
VCRNIIREEGLDIYRHPATGLEYPDTFLPDMEKLFEIFIPFMGVIMRILGIGMAEVIGG